MGIYNVHGGHNFNVPGAGGYFEETEQDRAVKDRVIGGLRSLGHVVYDCTDNAGRSQGQNLANIVANCNAHNVDLDISIHFNASNGAGHGVEVLCYDAGTAGTAHAICDAISVLGFTNRGVKYRQDLYVLSNTKAQAILIECCFCDNQTDANLYNADSMANAIVRGVTGQIVSGNPVPQPVPQPRPSSGSIDVVYQVYSGKWYPNVKNTEDFAGVRGKAISGIYANTVGDASVAGNLRMRVHVKNKNWLPWVFDREDFAGILGESIDAVQMELINCPGRKVQYRVSPLNGDYYPWVTNTEDQGGCAGIRNHDSPITNQNNLMQKARVLNGFGLFYKKTLK